MVAQYFDTLGTCVNGHSIVEMSPLIDSVCVNTRAHHDGDEMHRQTKHTTLSTRVQGTPKHAVRCARVCNVVLRYPLCLEEFYLPASDLWHRPTCIPLDERGCQSPRH
jgi:hypothetical protein